MLKVANILLAAIGIVAAGAFAYGLTALPSNTVAGIAVCVAAGLLLGAIAFAFLKGGEWPANLVLVAVSAGLSLFAVNLALMAITPKAPIDSAQAATRNGAPFDLRTPFEVVSELRSEGVSAYPRAPILYLLGEPALRADLTDILPLGGVSGAMTVLCNESGEYTIYQSDRYGFNNDDSVHDRPGGVDMLVVGDSFAQGYCVPPGLDLAGQLRGLGANAVTVGNAANGPLLELATLIEYGQAWRPPTVLWLYYAGNDIHDLFEERQSQLLLSYLDGYRQNLPARQDEVDALLQRIFDSEFVQEVEEAQARRVQSTRETMSSLRTRLKEMVTLYEVRRRLNIDRASLQMSERDVLPMFERILRQADETVRGWGGQLHVVYLPDWETFAQRPAVIQDDVMAIFQRIGVPVINFETRLRQTGDPLGYFPFRLPNHYTAEGYSILTEQIWNILKGTSSETSGLLPGRGFTMPPDGPENGRTG